MKTAPCGRSVATVATFGLRLGARSLFGRALALSHASEWPPASTMVLTFFFCPQKRNVWETDWGETMERKETNLKGIDFLIPMNTFPLLRASTRVTTNTF